MKRNILIFTLILAGFWIIYLGLQNDSIYNKSLGIFSKNWVNQNGERQLVDAPYIKVNNTNYVRWDGVHYQHIKESGYKHNIEEIKGDYIFAFFPLFPAIWRISHLPPIGILFLNYLMFSISILLLLHLISNKKDHKNNILLSLSLPSLVIFFIPYSEATFLLAVSIGVYGFVKKKYWVFFTGFLLASLARPAYTFLALSIIGTELFFLLNHKKILETLKNIFIRVLPLAAGTLIVSGIQLAQGSGSVTKFIEVQKYWANTPSIPHYLRDWSHEGFAINIGVIFLIFAPLVWVMFLMAVKNLGTRTNPQDKTTNVMGYRPYYLVILSIIYLVSSTLFIILFRGGSLHCLFRFTLCSPFAFILLFSSFPLIKKIPKTFRFFILSMLSMLSIFILGLADYSTYWDFSDFGIFLLIAVIFFWAFQEYSSNILYKSGLYISLLLNIIWSTYLFNAYISDGWIFA